MIMEFALYNKNSVIVLGKGDLSESSPIYSEFYNLIKHASAALYSKLPDRR